MTARPELSPRVHALLWAPTECRMQNAELRGKSTPVLYSAICILHSAIPGTVFTTRHSGETFCHRIRAVNRRAAPRGFRMRASQITVAFVALSVQLACSPARMDPATGLPVGQMGPEAAIARARADSVRLPYTAADIHFMSGM